MSKAWIYILRCADGSYYVGHTTNLELRLAEHQAGEGSEWTQRRLPVELVFSQEMPDKEHSEVVSKGASYSININLIKES